MSVICCISDCHLGYMHRLKKERLEDYENAFTEAVAKAMEYKPELLIFGGDLLHHTRPDPRSLKLLLNTLMQVASQTQVIVSIGNHELDGHLKTAYQPLFSDLHENIHVLSTDNPRITLEIAGEKVMIHGFQYLRGRENAEEELKKTTAELSLKGKAGKNILCMHQAIEGYLAPFEISLRAFKEASHKYDLVLVGHVHKYQRIREASCPAYYMGATERTSFNESENATGFLVFKDFDFDNPVYVETKAAPMRRIKEDIGKKTPAEINEHIKKLIEANSDVRCLQITLEADVAGDTFSVRTDWEKDYPGYVILAVSVLHKIKDVVIKLEKTQIEPKLIEEYFEKKGMGARKDLLDACVRFYERYGC